MPDQTPLWHASAPLRRGAAFCLLVAALAAGCAPPGDMEDVAMRLGPADFGVPAPPERAPVVQIGNEGRPVIEQPATITIAERFSVPVTDGVARFKVRLPASAAALDDSAFVLTVRRDITGETDEIAIAAALVHYVRRDHGWRLRRNANDPASAVVELDEPSAAPGTTLPAVKLAAIGRVATTLVSRRFEVPPRARLLLGYCIGRPPRDAALGDSTFHATLECDGRPPETVLDQRIGFGDPRATSWQSAYVELPPRGSRCRLRLESGGAAATLGRGIWAVPVIFSRPDRRERERPNVVLISLDTLRADHLSSYGYPRGTSPQIDRRLAARGTRFADVSTSYPLTNVAHMSLMSGLFAQALPQLGLVGLWTPVRLLAEVLRDADYVTAAYTEDAGVSGSYGFWFGFDRYIERPLVGEARGTETFADGARFLRDHRDQRFFLFLHTYKAHAPYSYSPPYSALFKGTDWRGALAAYEVPAEQQGRVDAYDRAIREADDQVAGFLTELDRLGLARDTYVVLLADHGEAFGEHGLVGHGLGPQQEQLHVPLIVRGPGVPRGAVVDAPVSIVDVAPTILALVGVAAPDVQGRSLVPAFAGEALPRDRALLFSWIHGNAEGLRQGRWKLIDDGRGRLSLFDLASDPHERHPIDDAAAIAPLRATFVATAAAERARREQIASAGAPVEPGAASERQLESLRALGYVQ